MNRLRTIFIVICILSCWHAFGLTKQEKAFIEKYSLDAELTAQLDAHTEEILDMIKDCTAERCKQKHAVWELPWMPDYLLKRSFGRINGMEKIRAVIEEFNLDRIIVPQKYLYHIPGRPEDLNIMNYFVIVPKLRPKETEQPLSLREVQELCIIIEETGYCDMQKPNIIRLENGLIAMIDTDSWAFNYPPYLGIMRLLTHYGEFKISRDYTEQAHEFILKQLEELQPTDSESYQVFYTKLYSSLKRDPKLLARFNELFSKPEEPKTNPTM